MEEQGARYAGDAWGALVDAHTGGLDYTSAKDILGPCFDKEKGQWNSQDYQRVGKIMQHLGWRKERFTVDGMRDYY